MKRFLVLYGLTLAVGIAACGGSDPKSKKMAVDSMSPTGPAPDNNAANNPSLADTGYEKNRTTPVTDTMKKDSGR